MKSLLFSLILMVNSFSFAAPKVIDACEAALTVSVPDDFSTTIQLVIDGKWTRLATVLPKVTLSQRDWAMVLKLLHKNNSDFLEAVFEELPLTFKTRVEFAKSSGYLQARESYVRYVRAAKLSDAERLVLAEAIFPYAWARKDLANLNLSPKEYLRIIFRNIRGKSLDSESDDESATAEGDDEEEDEVVDDFGEEGNLIDSIWEDPGLLEDFSLATPSATQKIFHAMVESDVARFLTLFENQNEFVFTSIANWKVEERTKLAIRILRNQEVVDLEFLTSGFPSFPDREVEKLIGEALVNHLDDKWSDVIGFLDDDKHAFDLVHDLSIEARERILIRLVQELDLKVLRSVQKRDKFIVNFMGGIFAVSMMKTKISDVLLERDPLYALATWKSAGGDDFWGLPLYSQNGEDSLSGLVELAASRSGPGVDVGRMRVF